VSFRLRLTFIGAALVALTLLAFGWLVYQLVSNSQATAQDDVLKQRAADSLAAIRMAPAEELNGTLARSVSGAEDLQLAGSAELRRLREGQAQRGIDADAGAARPVRRFRRTSAGE